MTPPGVCSGCKFLIEECECTEAESTSPEELTHCRSRSCTHGDSEPTSPEESVAENQLRLDLRRRNVQDAH